MITKIGTYLQNVALGGVGYADAAQLTPEEEAALKQKYNLAPDANLRSRNIGRSMVGGTIGSLAGLGAGGYIGSKMLANQMAGKGRLGRYALLAAPIGMAAGALLGSKMMTDKYSKANAQKAMYEQSLGQ